MANLTSVRIGQTSTTTFVRAQRYRIDFTVPALSSGGSAETTVTVSGLSTSDVLIFQPRLTLNSSVSGVQALPRCSTTDELVLVCSNNTISTLSGSTQSGYLLAFKF
jgi:hypothetical protein